jgi:spore maturation protein CgeB
MNIAIIGKYYTEGSALHIEETLLEMGHTVVRFDPEIQFMQYDFLGQRIKNLNKTLYQEVFHKIPAIRNIKSRKLFEIYKNNKVDFTLVLHDYLTKEEIDKIKIINKSPIVIWFPDPISNFQKAMFFIAGYDHLFFCDKYIVNKLKEEFDLNTHFLPQCFNPNKHKNITSLNTADSKKYKCDITNAGNIYPSRAALYKHLTKYNFKMWGFPPAIWMKVPELDDMLMKKSVFNEEKSKAFKAAKIVLNNLHPAVIDGINKRSFEICGTGALQIISDREVVYELFEVGKEIVTYKNLEDLINKIDYYIDPVNNKEREKIAEAGYKRAINEHTYENRLTQLLNICNFNK